MKAMRDASSGLSNFPPLDKFLIRFYLFYLFVVPGISMVTYEMMLDEKRMDLTSGWWTWLFFLPIVMHIGFVINNLSVPASSWLLALMIIRIPGEVVIMSFLYDWDPLYAMSTVYAIELFGFCIGLLFGTVFRKAPITAAHRLLSFALIVGIVLMVYFRFNLIFKDFINPDKNSLLQILSGVICIAIAAAPHIRIFVYGKAEEEVKMGTSNLSNKMTPFVAISAIVYSFILPMIIYWVIEGF